MSSGTWTGYLFRMNPIHWDSFSIIENRPVAAIPAPRRLNMVAYTVSKRSKTTNGESEH